MFTLFRMGATGLVLTAISPVVAHELTVRQPVELPPFLEKEPSLFARMQRDFSSAPRMRHYSDWMRGGYT